MRKLQRWATGAFLLCTGLLPLAAAGSQGIRVPLAQATEVAVPLAGIAGLTLLLRSRPMTAR